jgi:hypothetical protein
MGCPEVSGQAAARSPDSVLRAKEMGLADDEPAKIHSMNDVTHDAAM